MRRSPTKLRYCSSRDAASSARRIRRADHFASMVAQSKRRPDECLSRRRAKGNDQGRTRPARSSASPGCPPYQHQGRIDRPFTEHGLRRGSKQLASAAARRRQPQRIDRRRIRNIRRSRAIRLDSDLPGDCAPDCGVWLRAEIRAAEPNETKRLEPTQAFRGGIRRRGTDRRRAGASAGGIWTPTVVGETSDRTASELLAP
jgi:hypothetical protein